MVLPSTVKGTLTPSISTSVGSEGILAPRLFPPLYHTLLPEPEPLPLGFAPPETVSHFTVNGENESVLNHIPVPLSSRRYLISVPALSIPSL